MHERFIKQDFCIWKKLIIVEDAPAGVLPQCGVKVVKAGKWITKLTENSEKIVKAPKTTVSITKFISRCI